MDMYDRHINILEYLKTKNVVTIKEISSKFNVSHMTVRRDISILEKQNLVRPFHGGVAYINQSKDMDKVLSDYSIDSEIIKRKEFKQRIAKKAASLINPYESIIVDTGSTTAYLVDLLPEDTHHIAYCYALNIINGLCNKKNYNVIACGGYYHSNTSMFECDVGLELLKKTYINKAFMTAQGIISEIGVTVAEPYEVEMKRTAMSVSETKILLADSTKFGKSCYAKYAELDDFDIIITDYEINKEYKKIIEDKGIILYTV